MTQFLWYDYLQKAMYRPRDIDLWPMKVIFKNLSFVLNNMNDMYNLKTICKVFVVLPGPWTSRDRKPLGHTTWSDHTWLSRPSGKY